jgi:outer membrane immunogenic protein
MGGVVKKQLLMGAALGALTAMNPALAADLPVKAPVRAPVVAPYNWTGCYVGGNIGYGWGRARGDINTPDINTFGGVSPLGLPTSFPISHDLNGVIGGGQIGCNWQFDNRWVLGLETDFQGSGEKHSTNRSDPYNDGEGFSGIANQSLEAKIQWFGTVRGRAGVLVTPTILLYGTGGLAYGKTSVVGNITATGTSPNGPFVAATSIGDSKTKVGWTLGAGVEGVLFNSNNWTWKAEYLYIDLGSLSGSGVDPLIGPYSWNAKFTDNIVRFGLNYRIP